MVDRYFSHTLRSNMYEVFERDNIKNLFVEELSSTCERYDETVLSIKMAGRKLFGNQVNLFPERYATNVTQKINKSIFLGAQPTVLLHFNSSIPFKARSIYLHIFYSHT